MTLLKLDILAVRNIHQASLLPSPALNFITGPNASGKSSLLEAIYILGRSRSFRTSNVKQVIEFGQSDLIVSAKMQKNNAHIIQLGIQIGKKSEIHINHELKQKADLAYCLPIQLIHPKSYHLIDAGPGIRRQFIDWGVFNQDHDFLSDWRKFSKILRHRNILLKKRKVSELDVWNDTFVQYAEAVTEYRENYIRQLEPVFLQICQYFLDSDEYQLKFVHGWNQCRNLISVLEEELEKDLRLGYTYSGPQRSDFHLLINNKSARDYVSRGQMKLLVLSLMLAQVKLVNKLENNSVCILIDDLTSELDTENREKLVKYMDSLNCQVFMSSTELSGFGQIDHFTDYKVFHVEHGFVNSQ